MKITIDLTEQEYGSVLKMAKYAKTTEARIVEALIQGAAEASYLNAEGDLNWSGIVDYLREVEGDSPRLRLIERYIDACEAHSRLPLPERAQSNFGQFESLEAFRKWERGNFDRN